MFVYIITISATFLTFMAILSSLRFIFSRQGIFWIIPLLISAILFYQNINTLLYFGEGVTDGRITFLSILPVMLALFWYALIIIFHYTLKLAIPENKYINDSKKNLKEAQYLEKFEIRRNKREREDITRKTSSKNKVPQIQELHNGKLVE